MPTTLGSLCHHCGQAPVSGPHSELCAPCYKTWLREVGHKWRHAGNSTPQFGDDNDPDDENDWGIPGPEVDELTFWRDR